MAADGFAWWRRRIARQRELFDLVRIDHFRGLRGGLARAGRGADREGRLLGAGPGPRGPRRARRDRRAGHAGRRGPRRDHARGRRAARRVRPARDEGAAVRLRRRRRTTPTCPQHHGEQSVVYTGTHDNDTTARLVVGARRADPRAGARRCLADPDEPMPWALVRLALSSTARLAVVPAQDLLGLGSESRMNTPGTADGQLDLAGARRRLRRPRSPPGSARCVEATDRLV